MKRRTIITRKPTALSAVSLITKAPLCLLLLGAPNLPFKGRGSAAPRCGQFITPHHLRNPPLRRRVEPDSAAEAPRWPLQLPPEAGSLRWASRPSSSQLPSPGDAGPRPPRKRPPYMGYWTGLRLVVVPRKPPPMRELRRRQMKRLSQIRHFTLRGRYIFQNSELCEKPKQAQPSILFFGNLIECLHSFSFNVFLFQRIATGFTIKHCAFFSFFLIKIMNPYSFAVFIPQKLPAPFFYVSTENLRHLFRGHIREDFLYPEKSFRYVVFSYLLCCFCCRCFSFFFCLFLRFFNFVTRIHTSTEKDNRRYQEKNCENAIFPSAITTLRHERFFAPAISYQLMAAKAVFNAGH